MSPTQEKKIVELAKKDLSAFKYLYDNYFPKIYSYVYYLTGDKEITEDIVSSTFEKAITHIHQYNNKGFSFGAWLYTIARNNVYDRSRNKVTISLEILEDSYLLQSDINIEKQVMTEIEIDSLKKAISQLPSEERELIVLRYIEGWSIKEVAKILNKSEDSVKSKCKRIFKYLREYIEYDTKK